MPSGQTVEVMEHRVRALINDVDNDPAIPFFQLWSIMNGRMQRIAAEIGVVESRTANYVTLVAGDYDYVVPNTPSEASYLREFIYQPTNLPLEKITSNQMEKLRSQGVAPVTPPGIPAYWSMLADASGYLLILHPPPGGVAVGEKLTAVFCLVPTSFANDGSTVIGFDDPQLRALEHLTAADCIRAMPDAKRKAKGLSEALAQSYEATGESLKLEGYPRLNQGKLQNRVVMTWR